MKDKEDFEQERNTKLPGKTLMGNEYDSDHDSLMSDDEEQEFFKEIENKNNKKSMSLDSMKYGNARNLQSNKGGISIKSKPQQQNISKFDSQPLNKKLLKLLLKITFDMKLQKSMYLKYAEERLHNEYKNNFINIISLLIQIIAEAPKGSQFLISQQQLQQSSQQKSQETQQFNPPNKIQTDSNQLVKIAAAIQLSQMNKHFTKLPSLQDQEKITFIRGILMIISQPQNCSQIKKHSSKALTIILENEQNKSQIFPTVLKEIQQLLYSNSTDKEIGGMLAIGSLILVPLENKQIEFIIETFLPVLIKLGQKLFYFAQEELNKFAILIEEKRLIDQEIKFEIWEDKTIDRFKVDSNDAEDNLSLLDNWGDVVNQLICLFQLKIQTKENSLSFLNMSDFFQLLNGVIHMQLNVKEQFPNSLVSFSTSYQIDSKLNSNLVIYIKIVSRCIKMLLKHRNKDLFLTEPAKNTSFCQMLKIFVQECVQTLMEMNSFLTEYGELYNEYKVDQSKNEIMGIVSQSLKISELNEYFFSQRVSFICCYVSPLLVVSDNTFEDFKKFGGSFLQGINEFLKLEDQEQNKIAASILTIKFCKYIHGALPFFFQFCVENIYSLLNNIPSSNPQFSVLSQADGSMIKTHFDSQKQLDMCLASLIALRNLIKERKDLLPTLDSFFIMNSKTILQNISLSKGYDQNSEIQMEEQQKQPRSLSNFILSEILLLFSELSDILLVNNEDTFYLYIQAILECSNSWNQLSGFKLQMYMNLFDMTVCKKRSERLKRYSKEIFNCLINQLSSEKEETYFDCLNAVIQQYRQEIFTDQQVLLQTIKILIEKILFSFPQSTNKCKSHLEGIKYPILILEMMMGWKDLPHDICIQVESYLLPLYNLLDCAETHDLSSSIVKIARLQVERLEGIKSQISYELLYKLRKVFDQESIFNFEMFKFINLLLSVHPSLVANDNTLLGFLVKLGSDGISTRSRFSISFDKSLSCLIVHLLMHNFNEQIKPEQYQLFLQSAINCIGDGVIEQYLSCRLIEIILTCIEINIQLSFSVLENKKFINQFFDQILAETGIFQEVYDKKLYIIGACKMLVNYQNYEKIRVNFVQLLSRVIDMLSKIKEDQEIVAQQLINFNKKKQLKQWQQVTITKKKNYNRETETDEVQSDSDIETNNQDDSNMSNVENEQQESEDEDNNSIDDEFKSIYKSKNRKNKQMEEEDQSIQEISKKKQLIRKETERDVAEMYEDSNEFKKMQKYAQTTFVEELPEIRNAYKLVAQDENSENSFHDIRKTKRAEKSVRILHTPLKKLDEFSLFQKTFEQLKQQLGEEGIQNLIVQLEPYQVMTLNELIMTERVVEPQQSAEQESQIRKIVKLRRKKQREENEVSIAQKEEQQQLFE